MIEQAGVVTPVPDIVQEVSLPENPVPDTVTNIPMRPEDGAKVTVGPVTVNIAKTKLPVPVPVTVMVY